MNSMINHTDTNGHDIENLLDMLTDLNSRVLRENRLTCLTKDEYDQIHDQFKTLDQNIFSHKDLSIDSNDRLEQLVDMMSSMADLDFTRVAEVREEYNHLDYIAISLNLMRERLAQRVFELKRMTQVLDSFSDLYVITDLSGMILRANKVLNNHYQIGEEEIIGMHIKDFFETARIQDEYSLDFERDRVIHDLRQGFVENAKSDVVLRISGNVYLDDNGSEAGYCYKVEPVSKKLYNQTEDASIKADLLDNLQNVIDKMSSEVAKNEEQREILKDIQQTYSDKNELTFMETMILNSINGHLKKG